MQYKIKDNSGDKDYFTIIPNYILNHSAPYDRDLYSQMKRIAGDSGTCWTSQSTLSKQCGISVNRLKKSLSYLVDHEWIKFLGKKIINTSGGEQEVNEYSIVNLWHTNNEFYQNKGVSLNKGVSRDDTPKAKGVSRDDGKGCHEVMTNKNSLNKNPKIREIKNFTPPEYCEVDKSEETYKTKKKIYEQKGIKYKPSKKTNKQARSFEVLKLLDYFKEKSYDLQGLEYFNNPKDKNSRMVGQASVFFTRCKDDERMAREVVDWYLDEYGEFCQYEPEQCFTPRTIRRFTNKDKIKQAKVFNI